MILSFAMVSPIALWILWPSSPLAALGVLMLSHALLLIPVLHPNLQWLGPVVTHFDTQEDEVWLTIDDGPADDTEEVLQMLERHDVRATFFVIGSVADAHPGRIAAILAAGHEVANHSSTHPSGTFWCLPAGSVRRQVDDCDEVLSRHPTRSRSLFRAPVGMKNPALHEVLRKRHMRLTGWTVRGFDATVGNCEKIAARILSRTGRGAILVMHQGRQWSVSCMEHLVAEVRRRGYRFVIPASDALRHGR